jgi:hypothetical protein
MGKAEKKLEYATDALESLRRTLMFVEGPHRDATAAERIAWQIVKDTFAAFDVIERVLD